MISVLLETFRKQPFCYHGFHSLCRGLCYVTVCIFLSLSLNGCTSSGIYNDRKFNPPVYFGTHVVQKGETLYSISWRYGRGFKELARANGIDAPYRIVPGQKISLELGASQRKAADKQLEIARTSSSNVTKRKDTKSFRTKVTKVKKHKNFKDIIWAWPHSGPILAKYAIGKTANASRNVNKGIDIGGRLGDPVFAAASGEVVYSGNGLLGYGNLVIINHNERYLSAYAHNRKLLVKEGQKISKGQKIAEMGRSGVDRVKLHFEIRKDGDPVNPLKYLPSR